MKKDHIRKCRNIHIQIFIEDLRSSQYLNESEGSVDELVEINNRIIQIIVIYNTLSDSKSLTLSLKAP